ncbi:MAG: DUF1573 domain-containing protein [Muribaculaceae bacterium]|nr:DUF1573 domain-containing protein [Muribaculaceae bacterium]
MNKNSFTILLIALLLFPVGALSQIKWLSTSYDYGTFDEENGNVSCKIGFVNEGSAGVSIEQVRPTCGCTASDYNKRPIASGDTTWIGITYNPKGRPGKFEKDVVVITNSTPRRTVLKIRGNVIGLASTVMARYPVSVGNIKLNSAIVPYGELEKGITRTAFLDGYNQSKDTIVMHYENVPAHMAVENIPKKIAPGELVTITVYYNTAKKNDWGMTSDTFDIVSQSVGDEKEYRKQIEAIAIIVDNYIKAKETELDDAPKIALSTKKLDFGRIDRNAVTKNKAYFYIENKGKDVLILRKIDSFDKALIIAPHSGMVKKGKKLKVEVTLDLSQIEGKMLDTQIMITNNSPSQLQMPLRVVGEIK